MMGPGLGALIGGTSVVLVLLVVVLLNPDKIERWVVLFLRFAARLNLLARSAQKAYVKHDLQSHINAFLKRHSDQMPGLEAKGIRILWADEKTTRESFLRDGDVVVFLKKERENHENFVRATCLFVSVSLLFRAKRHLSKSQAEATDLFVSLDLLKEERPEVVDEFVEKYLHPRVGDAKTKINTYFDTFTLLNDAGYFYPVFLQELHFLGEKVFGGKRPEQINVEVDDLIEYLEQLSLRKVGDESVPLQFIRPNCRFAVVIVGRQHKLRESPMPYVNYIRNHLDQDNIESVYLVGAAKNDERIREVCDLVTSSFDWVCDREVAKIVLYDDSPVQIHGHVSVLRRRRRTVFQSSKTLRSGSA